MENHENNFGQVSRFPDLDLNPIEPEYEVDVRTSSLLCLVAMIKNGRYFRSILPCL